MAWEFNVQKVIAQSLAQPHDRGDDLTGRAEHCRNQLR